MKYFRVYTSFNDFIPIDSRELEKAMFAFITKSPVVFEKGATERIDRIIPDLHKAMGWNPAHRLDADDYNELKHTGIEQQYERVIGRVKERIQYLMETKQTHMVGKNIAIPQIDNPKNPNVLEGVKSLTNKMRL